MGRVKEAWGDAEHGQQGPLVSSVPWHLWILFIITVLSYCISEI